MTETPKQRFQNLPNAAKYALVLLAVVFISFLFPNNVRFKYEFTKGQSWRYDDLVAPFDFAIMKPEADFKNALKEAEEKFTPYYEMVGEVPRNKKQEFREAFNEQLEEVRNGGQYFDVLNRSDVYLRFGNRLIDRVYNRGILQLTAEHQNKDEKFVINLRNGNTTTKRTTQSFLKSNDTDDWITDSLFNSRLREAEFLIPLFSDLFTPNVFYNDTLTAKFKTEQLKLIAPTQGMVSKGDLIIARDGIVTDDIYQALISYKDQYEMEVTKQKSWLGVFLGYFLLTSLIIGVFILYLQFQAKKVFASFKSVLFMLMWVVLYSYIVYVVETSAGLSAYLIPFCIAPIVIRIFFNERLAFVSHVIIVLVASFLSSEGYEFTFLQILAGLVAILSSIEVRDWTRFFRSMLFIFMAYALGFLGLSLIEKGSIQDIDWSIYTWIFLNVLFTLMAYPLVPLLERLFGFISPITLVELSDMNRPLLRELSIKAPGTLQHSLQVANLAEAAATKIKADQLLVKVAALYHDIGKITKPHFFIENQSGKNPHDGITELESARAILDHITDGVALAKKNKLPNVIIDLIKTHHGTTRVEYFYRNYVNKYPDKQVDEKLFRYAGPRPRTKEEGILMIADSLEAASKSLKNPVEKDIDDLVEKIVAGKITQGQLEKCDLTFKELDVCKREFKKLLKSIHHVRIEYPE